MFYSPAVRRLVRSLCALTMTAACALAHAQATGTPAATWAERVSRFQQGFFEFQPTLAVWAGRHEFDGRLPDFSAAGLQRQLDWLLSERAGAAALDIAALSPRERFERDYLLAVIDGRIFWLRDAEGPQRNPAFYADTIDPSLYLSRPYAPLDERMKAFIRYAQALPTAAAQIRANLRTPMPRSFVDFGANVFGGMPGFLRKEVPKVFARVRDPALQRGLKQAIGPAAAAMEQLAHWVEAQRAGAGDDFALGPQRFASMLAMTERVNTPLPELAEIARADLARNHAALKDACAQLALGQSLRACIARVQADKTRGGPIDGARAQLAGLRQFIVDKDLATIPAPTQVQVALSPEYQRWNFAYIEISGPFDKEVPAVYRIAPPDPRWPRAERIAYLPGRAMLLFTSVHEVWPGHFLQFMHSNESDFAFGQVFIGYAFSEGWAHYGEQMMWDAGLGQGSPEAHIGQLDQALMRDVRMICAIGLHTQGMSLAECEKLFRDEAFQDAGNARQQAARGSFDPGYLNYTLGKLMIMKLREDWTASRGGRQAWKAFHDQFLSYGGPPIPLVREQMMGVTGGSLF